MIDFKIVFNFFFGNFRYFLAFIIILNYLNYPDFSNCLQFENKIEKKQEFLVRNSIKNKIKFRQKLSLVLKSSQVFHKRYAAGTAPTCQVEHLSAEYFVFT